MANASDLVRLQECARSHLTGRDYNTVTHIVLRNLKKLWLGPVVVVSELLKLPYQDEVRAIFRPRFEGDYNHKIEAIEFVRTGHSLGLKDAKEYVEWICDHSREPEFVQHLPGYVPF